MTVITKIFSSRRVWLAILALIVTVIGAAYPQMPPSIITAFQGLAVLIIAMYTIDDSVTKIAITRVPDSLPGTSEDLLKLLTK